MQLASFSFLVVTVGFALVSSFVFQSAVGQAINTFTITDVGGAGCYPEVVKMIPGEWPTCSLGERSCVQQAKAR